MKTPGKKSFVRRREAVTVRAKGLLESGKKKNEEIAIQPIRKRVKKRLVEAVEAMEKGTEKVAEKAATIATLAGVKYKIYEHNHKLQKLLAELGGEVYELAKRNPQALSPTDPEVVEMIGKIADMEKKITALEERAKSLKKKRGVSRGGFKGKTLKHDETL
jgi:hypothetical protein